MFRKKFNQHFPEKCTRFQQTLQTFNRKLEQEVQVEAPFCFYLWEREHDIFHKNQIKLSLLNIASSESIGYRSIRSRALYSG